MEKKIKAIDTEYNGFLFRSRIEAKWAIYFDALGVKYQYEPEGYLLPSGEKYLPDFFFPKYDAFGEVKPEGFRSDKRHIEFVNSIEKSLLLFCGNPGAEPNLQIWKEAGDDVRKIDGLAFAEEIIGKFGIMYYGDVSQMDLPALDYATRKANRARFEHGVKNAIVPFKQSNKKTYSNF